MSTAFLTSLKAGLNAPSALIQSAQIITGYVSWIESQTSSAAGDQSGIIDKVKGHAAPWYNAIYPQFLNMPDFIARESAQVNRDFNLLIDLADQYSAEGSPPPNALAAQITKSATDLVQTVNAIAQQADSLAQAIQRFDKKVARDGTEISRAYQALEIERHAAVNKLSGYYGQLHHLQSATCPSKADISACEDLIAQTTQVTDNLAKGMQLLKNVAIQISSVTGARNYLRSYWAAVGADARICMQNLNLLTTTPAAITKLDLKLAQQLWNYLVQQYQLASKQLVA